MYHYQHKPRRRSSSTSPDVEGKRKSKKKKKSCCNVRLRIRPEWYRNIALFVLFIVVMIVVFVYQNELGFRIIIEGHRRQSSSAKRIEFFAEFQDSLLFGNINKQDEKATIKFDAFWDAKILVLDLDECFYSYRRKGATVKPEFESLKVSFTYKEPNVIFGSADSNQELVWNPEFEYLIKNKYFQNKDVYFYSASIQGLVDATKVCINRLFETSDVSFILKRIKEYRGQTGQERLEENRRRRDQEARQQKELSKLSIRGDDKKKFIMVMDDSGEPWSDSFDVDDSSHGPYQPKKDTKTSYPKAQFIRVKPFQAMNYPALNQGQPAESGCWGCNMRCVVM